MKILYIYIYIHIYIYLHTHYHTHTHTYICTFNLVAIIKNVSEDNGEYLTWH